MLLSGHFSVNEKNQTFISFHDKDSKQNFHPSNDYCLTVRGIVGKILHLQRRVELHVLYTALVGLHSLDLLPAITDDNNQSDGLFTPVYNLLSQQSIKSRCVCKMMMSLYGQTPRS